MTTFTHISVPKTTNHLLKKRKLYLNEADVISELEPKLGKIINLPLLICIAPFF